MRRQSVKKPISEVQITNPYPVGSIKYKEFEKDSRKGYFVNGAGNYVVYKTSGAQRAIIAILVMILMVVLAK